MKNVLIIVPHADDEHLIAQPFLYGGNNINIVFTHSEDNPSKSVRERDREVISALGECTTYSVYTIPNAFNSCEVSSVLDQILSSSSEPWTVVTTTKTDHPAHRECNVYARQLLRPNTMKSIDRFLEAPPLRGYVDGYLWNSIVEGAPSVCPLQKYQYKLTDYYIDRWESEIISKGGFTFKSVFNKEKV